MEIRQVVERYDAVVYDGTNGTEIAVDLFEADPATVHDDGETLVLTHPNGEEYRVTKGYTILFIDNRGINDAWCDWYGTEPPHRMERSFRDVTDTGSVRDLAVPDSKTPARDRKDA